jgi:hypothetical protein
LGMQHFLSDSFSETVGEIDNKFKPFVRGSYRVAETEWPVVSLTALSEHPELEKLAIAS